MSHRKLYLALGIAIGLLILVACFFQVWQTMSYKKPIKDTIGHAQSTLTYEIADTPAKQELGLGNRASIPDNYGMLFVFAKDDRYGFWMKDMLVPIDMLWLSDNGTVVAVDDTVEPDTYPHAFYPPVPVRYVVETRAGFAASHDIVVGSVVPLPAPY